MITTLPTMRFAPPTAAAPAAPAASGYGATDLRPNVEWWEADGKRYDSTADLVKTLAPGVDGTDATYHFRQATKYDGHDANWDTAMGAATGAAVGAGVGALGVAALDLLGVIGTVLTAGFYGTPEALPLLGSAAVLAGAGAVIGAISGRHYGRDAFVQGDAIPGKILDRQMSDGSHHQLFYPGGKLDASIDLTTYAAAKPAPEPAAPPAVPKWKDALHGALYGALAPASTLVPIAGPFLPSIAGYHVGASVDSRPHRGGLAGLVVGAGLTAGSYASLAAGSPLAFGALTVASAGTGALLGPALLPRMRASAARDAVTADQWWSRIGQDQNS